MNTRIRNLGIIVIVLAALSVWVYTQQTKRGTDLVAGSDFIKGLDVEKVATITLRYGAAKADESKESKEGKDDQPGKPAIVLKRDNDRFVLADQKSYPAATAKVNDLMFKIADIQVKKLINSDASDDELKALGLLPTSVSPRSVHATIADESGKTLMAFRLGKDQKNGGTYMLKDGTKQVYVSKRPVFLAQSYRDFVDWTLLRLKPESLERVEQSQPKLVAERLAGQVVLVDPTSGNPLPSKPEKTQQWFDQMAQIDFEDFYPATDQSVAGLNYDQELALTFGDKMVYELKLAKDKEDHFIALSARVADLPSEVVINPDDDQQKLAGIESMITAKERAERINRQRSGWIYKISKADYERLIKTKKFFL